jgi:hypothetical protein
VRRYPFGYPLTCRVTNKIIQAVMVQLLMERVKRCLDIGKVHNPISAVFKLALYRYTRPI